MNLFKWDVRSKRRNIQTKRFLWVTNRLVDAILPLPPAPSRHHTRHNTIIHYMSIFESHRKSIETTYDAPRSFSGRNIYMSVRPNVKFVVEARFIYVLYFTTNISRYMLNVLIFIINENGGLLIALYQTWWAPNAAKLNE